MPVGKEYTKQSILVNKTIRIHDLTKLNKVYKTYNHIKNDYK
jgi:hypothetical protein